MAIHGTITCPKCSCRLEVSLTMAPQSQTQKSLPSNGDDTDLGELLGMIDDGSLTGLAINFVAETRKRFAQYGAKTRMSEKQLNWLKKLANVNEDADEWEA